MPLSKVFVGGVTFQGFPFLSVFFPSLFLCFFHTFLFLLFCSPLSSRETLVLGLQSGYYWGKKKKKKSRGLSTLLQMSPGLNNTQKLYTTQRNVHWWRHRVSERVSAAERLQRKQEKDGKDGAKGKKNSLPLRAGRGEKSGSVSEKKQRINRMNSTEAFIIGNCK